MKAQPGMGKMPPKITPQEWALLPPTEYISAFTLQQKNAIGTSFGSNTDRFNVNKPGSYFANTHAIPSSFKSVDPHHKPKILTSEEVPRHRPLWLNEIRKEVPAGTQYEIESTFGSKKTLFKTRVHSFSNNYSKYQRTCDIQKDIKVFNQNADQDTRGVASYDIDRGLTATKKRNPSFSQSKSKQHQLFD